MFLAAFTSRSWTVPHAWHVHSRTLSGLGPSVTPHAEHTWLAVVIHHPRTPEHPRQGLLLPRRRVEAIPVPDLHDTRACHRPKTTAQEHRRGRYVVSALHAHWVVVTTYRRGVLDADMPRSCENATRKARRRRRGAAGAQRPRRSRAPAGAVPAQGRRPGPAEQPQGGAGPADPIGGPAGRTGLSCTGTSGRRPPSPHPAVVRRLASSASTSSSKQRQLL